MKIMQIYEGFVHWHTPYQSIAETVGKFPPTDLFVEAPDYVFEGWGYLDGEFIKPAPPEGWLYDDATGTFYRPEDGPPVIEPPDPTIEELTLDLLADHEYRLCLVELGII